MRSIPPPSSLVRLLLGPFEPLGLAFIVQDVGLLGERQQLYFELVLLIGPYYLFAQLMLVPRFLHGSPRDE